MNQDWPLRTIAECASPEPYSTQIGPFGEKLKANSYTQAGVPVLRGTNVNSDDRFHDDDFVFIDPAWASTEFDKFECQADDVILCHKGTLGRIGIVPRKSRFPKYIMGNSMLRVRCDRSKLEPLYLYYWLCSAEGQNYLFSRVSQVGVPQIQRPLSTLREASLRTPPIDVQRAIASILGALDDKIELNRRMNNTLEELARTIFKSWFVELNAQPTAFTPSDQQQLQIGWRSSAIEAVIRYTRDGVWGKAARAPDHVQTLVIRGTDFAAAHWGDISTAPIRYVPLAEFERKALEPNDILIETAGGTRDQPTGRTALISARAIADATFPICCASFARFLRTDRSQVEPQYLFRFLDHLYQTGQMEQHQVQHTGVARFQYTKFAERTRISVPPLDVQRSFAETVQPFHDRQVLNTLENSRLGKTRDSLLPKLISGELRIPAAERLVGDCP